MPFGLSSQTMTNLTETLKNTDPTDVVICWVDGSDPHHQQKMTPFLKNVKRSSIPGAHPTRFASVNEIRYCVLSVLTFASFVRNIYIVTDEQDPGVHDDVKKYFPERLQSVKIVDHKEIFRGYEKYLPTFSSRAIESMIWRIEGLADNFIYLNDDVFLIRDTRKEDFFLNERPVLRGSWCFDQYLRLSWKKLQGRVHKYLLGNKNFQSRSSFHLVQWMSASYLGMKWKYFYMDHTPHPLNRKAAGNFFMKNKIMLEKNLEYRFKNHRQYNFISLQYHHELLHGNKHIVKPALAYLQPCKRSENYLERKIRLCEKNDKIKFLCIQSMEICGKDQQKKVFDWLDHLIGLKPGVTSRIKDKNQLMS